MFGSDDLLKIHSKLCSEGKSQSMESESMETGHTEEKPKICNTCYLVFESDDLFQEHKLMCNEEKPIRKLEVENGLEQETVEK